MKKNEELFHLIKSLSKSEKRYFKLETQQNESADYLLLFDAIDQQKTYNESEIKTLFKDKGFIVQLTTIKNYLKQRILQSLRNFHQKISKNAEVIDILRNVEILFHKGQYQICESELKRAEKKAIQFQNDILLFQVQDWKRKTHQAIHPEDFTTLHEIAAQQKKTLQQSNEHINLILGQTDPNQQSITHKKGKTLIDKTIKAIHKHKFQSQPNHYKAKETLEKVLKEWELHPELQKEFFNSYFAASNQLIKGLLSQSHHQEAYLRVLKIKKQAAQIRKVSAAYSKELMQLFKAELEIHQHLKSIHTTHELIEEITKFVRTHDALIPTKDWMQLKFQIGSIYFSKRDYNNANNWISNLLDDISTKKQHKELTIKAYRLSVLIQYQLQDRNTLKKQISALKKELNRTKNIASYEHSLFQFLSKSILQPEHEQRIALEEFSQAFLSDKPNNELEIESHNQIKSWVLEKL